MHVLNTTAEDAALDDAAFDVGVIATALHWLDVDRWSRRLTASGYFIEYATQKLRWSIDLDADQIRGLFSTFSDWTADEADAAARAVEDLGGHVTEHYITTLIVLDRSDVP